MTLFKEMAMPEPLQKALEHLNFSQPTPIQLQTIPASLSGKDIMGSAQTGTGKTLAFSVPLVAHLLANPQAMALVLTPTRELAQQVALTIKQLVGNSMNIRSALLIGGEQIGRQFQQLKGNPRIIVGTPGRVIDHLERKTLRKNNFSFLVLDETDRMFDMGFGIQLDQIISQLPTERQTLMFSATFPPKIEKLAANYMITPQRVFVDAVIAISDKLKQENMFIKDSDKYDQLLTQLNTREGSIIVFVKTKINADRLATQLVKMDHNAAAIHGDLRQHKRERVMMAFRQGRYRILIATDVAARGLDVPELRHVINYDLPQASEDFIHRIGRTARNGAEGSSLTFISMKERKLWDDIQRLINPNMAPAARSGRFDRNDRAPSGRGAPSFARKPSNNNSSNFRKGRSDDRNQERTGDRNSERTGGNTDRAGGNAWGTSERRPFERGTVERRPFERGTTDRRPSERGTAERRPFERDTAERRPFERGTAERRPFERDTAERRPFERGTSERRPFEGGNSERRPSERPTTDRRPSEGTATVRRSSSGGFSSDRQAPGAGYGPKKPTRSGGSGGAGGFAGRGNFRAKA